MAPTPLKRGTRGLLSFMGARTSEQVRPTQKETQEAARRERRHNQARQPGGRAFRGVHRRNATKCQHVVEVDSAKGQHLILCGAGPSLRDEADEWCPQGDQIWGCNSAVTWLHDNGHNPTHAFCIDQTAAMLNEWATTLDVEYLVASTVHPHLVQFLEDEGRFTRFFHNYVGINKPAVSYCLCGHDEVDHEQGCSECDCEAYDMRILGYEDWLYARCYNDHNATVMAGSGLNAVTRAVDVAHFMGFSKITVLGADCALRVKRPFDGIHGSPEHRAWLEHETEMHADGGNALASNATPITIGGEIDGRWWETKPDMMISAVWLVRMGKALGDGFQLIGDTLPNAIKDKPNDFLDRLPALIGNDGKPIKYPLPGEDRAST